MAAPPLVHCLRIQLTVDAGNRQLVGRPLPYALVPQRGQVEVVGRNAARRRQADQLRAVGAWLAVVLGQVGMKVHADFIPER